MKPDNFDNMVTQLILFVHDKGHSSFEDDLIAFMSERLERAEILYRGTRSTDVDQKMLSFTEDREVAERMKETPDHQVKTLINWPAFPLYKFLLAELTPEELEDLKDLLEEEKEWIVIRDDNI